MPVLKERQRKKVRLVDVARCVEISTSTASMALSGSRRISPHTRQRVIDACRQLGYQSPRQSHRNRQTKPRVQRIGLLMIGTTLQNPVNVALLHALTSQVQRMGLRLEISTLDDANDPRQALEFIAPCQGVLLCGNVTPSLLRSLVTRDVRAAVLGRPMPESGDAGLGSGVMIAGDDQGMGRLAAQRLLAAGHTRIGFVCEVLPPGQSHAAWLEGYRLALMAANVPIDPALLRVTGHNARDMARAADQLLALKQPPTALVVTDVSVAAVLLRRFNRHKAMLTPQATIIWSSPELAQRYQMETFPLIGVDMEQLVRAGLSHVTAEPTQVLPPGSQVLIPWRTWNLPAQSEGDAT